MNATIDIAAIRAWLPEQTPVPLSIPYFIFLGIAVYRGDSGAVVTVAERTDFHNSRAQWHGGVVGSILDTTMSMTARQQGALALGTADASASTVDMHVAFLKPANGDIVCVGEALTTGRTLVIAQALAYDANNEVVACATGTLRIRAL
jgi:uncharacterized protein (TIGR00369 family)